MENTKNSAHESIQNDLKNNFVKKHGEELYDTLSRVVSKELELMECIIAKRQALEMTQSQLAKALGTTQAVISRYESLERSPTLHVLLKILYILDININLMDWEGNIIESKWK